MIRLLGTFFMVVGVAGFVLIEAAPHLPTSVAEPLSAAVEPLVAVVMGETPGRAVAAGTSTLTASTAVPASTQTQTAGNAITRLVIPSIQLDTAVVPAALVEHDGLTTWDVPKFVAGHAEGSAGAGEAGNAVLIGHVTSLMLGHVFEDLDKLATGDQLVIFSSEARFEYRVTDVHNVQRTDTAVLEPTATPLLTLITCTGLWLPTVRDYTQRLIVQAALAR